MTNTFKYNFGTELTIEDNIYWIVERMRQEVWHPEVESYIINELYLLVPKGKNYTAFADSLDRHTNYYSVEQLAKLNN